MSTLAHRIYISYIIMAKTNKEKAVWVNNLQFLGDHLNLKLRPRNLNDISLEG
jgi:hypothetical protein